jgi:hypothetical protein
MAKELPYFKFEPNQWENGNIQMLSREDKGLFIDLCSMYWSRLGDFPLKLAIQKLCAGNATALNPLCDENIIQVIDGLISIEFLNEQLSEFENTSNQNSKNAREGWEKRRKKDILSDRNATALNPQCESDAIREEKRREEKIKEQLTEKQKEIVYDVSKKFNINEMTPNFRLISEFVRNCKNLDEFVIQNKYYHLYKEQNNEIKHGIKSYLGDGEWKAYNWESKYNSIAKKESKNSHLFRA